MVVQGFQGFDQRMLRCEAIFEAYEDWGTGSIFAFYAASVSYGYYSDCVGNEL